MRIRLRKMGINPVTGERYNGRALSRRATQEYLRDAGAFWRRRGVTPEMLADRRRRVREARQAATRAQRAGQTAARAGQEAVAAETATAGRAQRATRGGAQQAERARQGVRQVARNAARRVGGAVRRVRERRNRRRR